MQQPKRRLSLATQTRRLAYSYVKNQDDALDIVQESVKKALASVGSVRNPDTIKSWFYNARLSIFCGNRKN